MKKELSQLQINLINIEMLIKTYIRIHNINNITIITSASAVIIKGHVSGRITIQPHDDLYKYTISGSELCHDMYEIFGYNHKDVVAMNMLCHMIYDYSRISNI